jgi:formamidopyrimidine-DNA glycosylase
MPELPEVESIRRSLLPLVGARILDVEVRERRLRRPIARDFESRLRGRRIETIGRRGKYLLFALDGGPVLLAHLGMSGRIERKRRNEPRAPHDHVRLLLDRGIALVFNDPRRFGLLRVGQGEGFAELGRVGRDPLAEPCSADELRALVRGRKLPIKNLLMDQRRLCGLGNIYVNEVLYQAGIRPRRRAARLGRRDLERLAAALRSVLERAVRLGGSSISDYRDAEGRTGFFQQEHAVYDRAGEPCRRCRTIIRRVTLAGRSSFYCPRCQR